MDKIYRSSRLRLATTFILGPLVAIGAGACERAARQEPVANERAPYPAVAESRADGARPMSPPLDYNTERYAKIDDNAFHLTTNEPLSTFAIDIDTASYANVRRFLRAGQLPPADAVRIEELVNYFPYGTIEAADGHPLGVVTEIAPCPWSPGHLLARIRVAAPALPAERQVRKNLVFLLDVSGSMNDANKLPLVKEALTMLAARLDPKDRVGIVVYAGASGVVLEPTSDTDAIVAALDRLSAGGSTNGGAGIEAAYRLAREAFIEGGDNRVVLATDGDFNVGTTSQGELVRLVETQKKSGIFLTVLGFGTGNLNDAMLEQIANRGNGTYFYIDSAREAKKVLVEGGASNLVTVARDVKIQVELNPTQVASYRLVGYENRLLAAEDFENDKIDGGEIGPGHTVTALYEIVPAAKDGDSTTIPLRYQDPRAPSEAAASGELFTVKVRYQAPDQDSGASHLITVPVSGVTQDLAATSDDFRFAAAVAGFGMVLRDSPHKGAAGWDNVRALAEAALGEDPGGYRAEMLTLIDLARGLSARRDTR